MSTASYILGILAAVLTLGVVIEMLRRRRLRERHAVWWLLFGTLALVIGIFPGLLQGASQLLGVEVPTNLVFFVSVVVLFLVCVQHSAELTKLEDKVRVLAEESALQALRIDTLETASTSGVRPDAPAPDGLPRDADQG